MATAAAADAGQAVKTLMRLYSQNESPSIRERCLDAIDRLVSVGAFNVDEQLAGWER